MADPTNWTVIGPSTSGNSVSVTALNAGVSYDFEVIATNAFGTSTSTAVTAVTPAIAAPSAPGDLIITAVTPTSETLEWGASTGTGPIVYQPQFRPVGQTGWLSGGAPVSTLTATVAALNSGSTYDFQVLAQNAGGSSPSNIQTAATTVQSQAPSAPGAPVAWIITPTSVSLTWSASTSGTPPISYTIQNRVTGTTAWISASQPSVATSGSVNGLTPDTDYDFRIQAANSTGVSFSNTLTILSPITGTTVTQADYQPNQVLTASALDASFDSKLDVTGGSVGPLQMSQTAAGGSQGPMLALSRSAGGVSDTPMVSGTYAAVMADGPVIAYSSISMSLSVPGDSHSNGPAGNIHNFLSSLTINSFRSTTAPATGSQHSAVTGTLVKAIPAAGLQAGRPLADGWAILASATDSTNAPSSTGGSTMSINAPLGVNGRDDMDARYGAKFVYGEAAGISSGGYPAEISRGLFVGATSTTAYAKVIVETRGLYSSAAIDMRSASSLSATVTSATPGAPVTALAVDRVLGFASAGSPAVAITASNPCVATINGNPYSVVSVSLTPGSIGGVLTFASPVSAVDAAQGSTVIPSSHTVWLSEGGSGVLPGDIALNRAGTSRIYYDSTGGGATLASGSDRITLRTTSSVCLPVGSAAQRPPSPIFGDIRANSDTGQFEQWQPTTSSWISLGGGSGSPTGVAPGAATTVIAGTPTSGAVPLSWAAPTTGTPPFAYQVQFRGTGTTAWTNWGAPQSSTSTTVSGLTAGTRYDFQVITTNAYGSSTSAITSATTTAIVPAAPTGLTISSTTSTTVTLSWTASASGTLPISYTVQFRVTGTTTWNTFGSPISDVSESITGLSPNTSYDFQVLASNVGGSATSSTVTGSTSAAATVAPSAPTSLVAQSPTSSTLALSWVAPSTGTTPFSYQVFYRVTGQTSWNAFGSAQTTTSLTVIGLLASTSYDFEVTATNSAGAATSAVANGVTAATPVASNGSVAGSQSSGTSSPVISGPATGSVLTSNVLPITGIMISDPAAAIASGACTLKMSCTSGKVSSTIAGAQISGSGTNSITYSNTLSAAQTVAADLIYTAGATAGSDSVAISLTDQAGASNSITIAITISAASGGGSPGGAIPTDATGTVARPAQIMLNGFGINTRIDTAAYQTIGLSLIENCINTLGGVKLLRDGPSSSSDSTWWAQVAQATGTKFIAYIPEGNSSSFSTFLSYIESVPSQYLIAFEGCEQADTGQALGFSESLSAAATFQQTVWSVGQQFSLPVIQMSFGQGFDVNPNTGNYGTVGNLSAYATYGNLVSYLPTSTNTNYSLANGINFDAALPTPGKPAAISEFGWIQQASSAYNCTSPATAAAYLIETIFDAFLAGCPFYCWNGLFDNTSSSPIGLFTNTGSPRPSAAAIKNLFTLLSDTNSNAITFSPGKLNFSISNLPTNNGGSNGGYTCLLQKSDGSFWIAIWNEQILNNTSTGADITVAPITITLTLSSTTATSITVYDPTNSVTPVQSASSVSSLSFSLPARVLLVKVVHP